MILSLLGIALGAVLLFLLFLAVLAVLAVIGAALLVRRRVRRYARRLARSSFVSLVELFVRHTRSALAHW